MGRVLKRPLQALGISRVSRGTAEALRQDSVDVRHTRAILAGLLPRNGCGVDVGAHTGTVTATPVRIAPEGPHAAFEVLPTFAAHFGTTSPRST